MLLNILEFIIILWFYYKYWIGDLTITINNHTYYRSQKRVVGFIIEKMKYIVKKFPELSLELGNRGNDYFIRVHPEPAEEFYNVQSAILLEIMILYPNYSLCFIKPSNDSHLLIDVMHIEKGKSFKHTY